MTRVTASTHIVVAVISAIVVATIVGHAQQGAQAPLPTFRSGVNLVSVDVSVRSGTRAVQGLAAKDFEILDNGVPQDIVDVSYEKVPIDVTIALDVSQSVTGAEIDQLRQSIRQLMHDLTKADRLKLITFNARITRLIDLTSDASAMDSALKRVSASGGTSLYDALAVALVDASAPDRRQLVVALTDGVDGNSMNDVPALLDVAARTNAAVYLVVPTRGRPGVVFSSGSANGMTTTLTSLASRAGLTPGASSSLTPLATDTGGAVVPVAIGGDVTGTFQRVLDEFRSSYVLHFTPHGVAADGFHTLGVRVTTRDHLDVRARRGYFAQ